MSTNEIIIGEIEKYENTKIMITLTTFQEKRLINIREYFMSTSTKQWTPTKKGVMIPVKFAGDLVSLCEQAEDKLNEKN